MNPTRPIRPWTRVLLPLATLVVIAGVPVTAAVPQLVSYQGRVAVDGVNFTGTGQFKFALVAGSNVNRRASATATTNKFGTITGVTVTDGGSGYTRVPDAVIVDGDGSGAVLECVIGGGAVTAINVLAGGIGYSSSPQVRIDGPPASFPVYWSNAPDAAPADGQPDAAVSLAVASGLYSVLLGDSSKANMAALPADLFTHDDVRLRVWFDDGTHGFQQLSPDQRIAAVGYALMAGNVTDGAVTEASLADGAVSSAKLAAGAVTSTQLAAGAVQAGHIAPGAVGAGQIADGSITATQLAKPPRSGSIDSATLTFDFHQAHFTVPFSPPFATTPVVTLAVHAAPSALWSPAAWLDGASPASFSAVVSAPLEPVVVDPTPGVGSSPSLVVADSRPAIAYYDSANGDLKYVRAANAEGTVWGAPLTLDGASSDVGSHCSIALVGSYPAIGYRNTTGGDLKFIRATNATGSAWSTPVTVAGASDNVGEHCCLRVVSGNPAMSYRNWYVGRLEYVRANDADGTAWNTPVVVDTNGNPNATSLAVVNGRPAIAYCQGSDLDLWFVRAADATGSSWETPVALDSTGTTGLNCSLAVVNGRPAISYVDGTNGVLKYTRATDASGTAWSAPVTVATAANGETTLVVVDGFPAISCSGPDGRVGYARARDADGTTWGPLVLIDVPGSWQASMTLLAGRPAIAVYSGNDLRFVRAPTPPEFTLQWIALEP